MWIFSRLDSRKFSLSLTVRSSANCDIEDEFEAFILWVRKNGTKYVVPILPFRSDIFGGWRPRFRRVAAS